MMDSIFNRENVMFLRDPEGGVEDVQLMKNAGFNVIAVNVQKEIPLSEWDLVRVRAVNAGATLIPWCYIWTLNDLDRLLAIADDWSKGVCIVNIEKEIDLGVYSSQAVADKVAARDVAYSSICWLYNAVNWRPMTNKPMMLQIFPYEIPEAEKWEDCVKHAHDMGFSCVSMTFGTYDVAGVGQPMPEDYNLLTPYQLYTADDLTVFYPNYNMWSPKGSYKCCEVLLPPLTNSQFPYTGPYYQAGGKYKRIRGKTVIALKIAMERMAFGRFPTKTTYYGVEIGKAMGRFQQSVGIVPTGNYGKMSWEALKTAIAPDGNYAMTPEALRLVKEDFALMQGGN